VLVIPAIDLRGGRCVRLRRGDPNAETVYASEPADVARWAASEGARLLHVVDLDAALGTGSNASAIREIRAVVDVPLQIGGGVRTFEAVGSWLAMAGTRVILGTAAASDPTFVAEAVARWGERIAVAVDVRANAVMIDGWRTSAGPVERIVPAMIAAGARRLVVTAVGADGRMEGPDLALHERILALAGVPTIASGGIRSAADVRALAGIGVEAAIVGRALYEGTLSLAEALAAGAGRARAR
jgi:phosphoribosylformimino-5-aminoimidazole carboxamide ribotide isomerase